MAKKEELPPKARIYKRKLNYHGFNLYDNFAWLRDKNWQEVLHNPKILKPSIKKFLEDENKWADDNLNHLNRFRKLIFEEIKSKIKEDDQSLPIKDGKYFYLSETKKGRQYSILKRRLSGKSKSRYRTILDWNELSKKFKYFKPGGLSYSLDHNLFNYSFDDKGSEFFSIKTFDIRNRKEKFETIKETSGNSIWANNCNGFYYIKMNKNHRPSSLWFHKLNTKQKDDKLIYEEKNPRYFLNISETLSKKYLLLNIHDHETSEIYILDKDESKKTLALFCKRKKGIEYNIDHDLEKSRFIIMSNHSKAIDFKLSFVKEEKINNKKELYPYSNWKELIPHRKGILITDFADLRNFLIVQ